MFVLPLNNFTPDRYALFPLLENPSHWPIWLKDGIDWCLGVAPSWLLVHENQELVHYYRTDKFNYHAVALATDLSSTLKTELATTPCPNYPLENGFTGGLMGWMSYPESTQAVSEKIAFPAHCFGFYDVFIRPNDEGIVCLYAPSEALARPILQQLTIANKLPSFALTTPFKALMHKENYQQSFNKIQRYLHSGDCYQVNLAQAFKAQCVGDSIDAFQRLLALSQPPYAAFVSCPLGDILSLSPELFLQFGEDGSVLTRPIKGTRPRREDAAEDLAQFNDLATHPKDHAENVMIVDLLRNDLGKHAAIGSVNVPKLFSVESFPQVHHLVSDVTCQLKEDTHPLDLLFDAFPGGSITGAPKKRAMEIIDEVENCDRAIYCGTIGYLTTQGRGQWNIAIRTLLRVDDDIYAWAGGGIVADSEYESEYEECFNKMGAMMKALEDGLLEK